MLNFEEEMKAVGKGYVVMSLDEYNRLMDERAEFRMAAYNAEQLANRRIAEISEQHAAYVADLVTIEHHSWDGKYVAVFNHAELYRLACNALMSTLTTEEQRKLNVRDLARFFIGEATLAEPRPFTAFEDERPDADVDLTD